MFVISVRILNSFFVYEVMVEQIQTLEEWFARESTPDNWKLNLLDSNHVCYDLVCEYACFCHAGCINLNSI